MRSFVVPFFFIFRTVCDLLRDIDVFTVVPFLNSAGLAILAVADLRRGDFLSEKNCHKLVVSTSFWSWLLKVPSIRTSLKYPATFFWDCCCIVGMLTFHGSTKFWIWFFMFLKYVFFVFVLDAIFCGTNFFIFQDTVWLVMSS